MACILIGAAAQAGSALFLQSLIDSYILPMVGATDPDWNPLLRAITLMACLYLAGIIASWLWQWLIVTVEQGTLKKIRDDMFAHQQRLPIRYFVKQQVAIGDVNAFVEEAVNGQKVVKVFNHEDQRT